jgi:predicted Zn-ribbon and HTH transcriptional regulator
MVYVHQRLKEWAIYAEGRLLNDSPDDFLKWLNENSDNSDYIFNMEPNPCPKCRSEFLEVIDTPYTDNGCKSVRCTKCGYYVIPDYLEFPKTRIGALLLWNK